MSLPFRFPTFVLGVLQAACVAVPMPPAPPALTRLRGRGWALIAPASIVVVVATISAAAEVADGLTWLALIAVPPLAAVALRRAWPVAGVLLAVAWAAKGSVPGDLAAAVLTALSCVTLGWLLAAVTPATWLKAGIVVMAIVDAYLIGSDQLQAPNATLVAAAPPIGLPQLQFAGLDGASLGYGDLFVAGVFGQVLQAEGRPQLPAAALVLVCGTLFDLLFWVLDELPATVPVAVALLVTELRR